MEIFLKASYTNGSGLDFWLETKDSLDPILDKNETYSTVI